MNIRVSGLYRYPVKSLAANSAASLKLTEYGPEFDRRWMVVDENGVFLTQREIPKMARIKVAIESRVLKLRVPSKEELAVPIHGEAPRADIQVWNYQGPALDMGDAAAGLLSGFLGLGVRLVRLPENHDRRARLGPKISFADSYPILVISEASLELLNSKLSSRLPMDRFRPNIVLSGGEPHQEDLWKTLRIGSVDLESAEPCTRCVITTVDQESGMRIGVEPLKTLASYRRKGDGVAFGWFYFARKPGTIKVGDRATAR